jgi:hypothetical protein
MSSLPAPSGDLGLQNYSMNAGFGRRFLFGAPRAFMVLAAAFAPASFHRR